MRLFLAIALEEPVLDALCGVMAEYRRQGARGHFSRRENLHLTLHFLGEQPPQALPALRSVLDSLSCAPFDLALDRLGQFDRDTGTILWAGLRPCPPLASLHAALKESLRSAGFPVEARPYSPHLTLVRDFLPGSGEAPALPALTSRVRDVRLMESSRIRGMLTYTPRYIRTL